MKKRILLTPVLGILLLNMPAVVLLAQKGAEYEWQKIDKEYYYDGDLGALYTKDRTIFKLWAPLASSVMLNLYENGLDTLPFKTLKMMKGGKGIWYTTVQGDLWGKFYTYQVTNNEKIHEVLDPYAKSMSPGSEAMPGPGKGAVIDATLIGPALDFAPIDGFKKREDVIIYEIHVRDFTSDPSLSTRAQFGTYTAFIEKLDYLKQLGVTHIQLLPVMSYRWGDELRNGERMPEYAVYSNYQWGYDPHNYFSPEGMYSEDPADPELRVRELKELIAAIHHAGMGVILDAVYNHTADVSLLDDIVPGYYYFVTADGRPKESYGGGRLGTTHAMTRKLILNSITYWVKEYKVDGFRFDLMGELDAETIQMAYNEASKLNPDIIFLGEGWRTWAGDDGLRVTPADQDWMDRTNSAACFSDEMRNELKSGYGIQGQPRFITGGARSVRTLFNNIAAKPGNMTEDDPGDVVQYIAAHDNLTLHDIIVLSVHKDPALHEDEIQKRIRLGNTLILTSQGIAFLHGGQEYGRTKQWLAEEPPEGDFLQVEGISHPYFIENSFRASDAVNKFDWDKVTQEGIHRETMEYTRGLIALRRSSDAFRLGKEELVATNVRLLESRDIEETDLIIAYAATATSGETFYVFVNGDSQPRTIGLNIDLTPGDIVVDSDEAGTESVSKISGVKLEPDRIQIDPLTAVIIRYK